MSCKDYGYLFRCQTPNLVTFQCYVIVDFHLVARLLVSKVKLKLVLGILETSLPRWVTSINSLPLLPSTLEAKTMTFPCDSLLLKSEPLPCSRAKIQS